MAPSKSPRPQRPYPCRIIGRASPQDPWRELESWPQPIPEAHIDRRIEAWSHRLGPQSQTFYQEGTPRAPNGQILSNGASDDGQI